MALDLGFNENEDFELTFDDLDAFEADVFLISEDLDQTTNLLDLQADREASGGAAESENLDQVQKGSVVVEAELLDKSMDVAKEREACSDDAGLSESRDVSIDLGNCTKDERDVMADEGDKLEDSLVDEREQGNGMDDKNSLESSVQLDDECKESKGLDQEVKTRNFDVSDKEVEKEMPDGERTKTTKALTQNFRDKGKRVAETSKIKRRRRVEGRLKKKIWIRFLPS
ncbi:uncharacterized protein LOC111455451 [Cucurbita moschata]|uniref:Uncharacterized protein LOC111455451 n=1 Tax=Cucurbita moschata TaxID=3662 RepID=A0A6J1GN43_CUCMO|nr:uncharacterized protein LOC111455451 [Cucurbita moschata]